MKMVLKVFLTCIIVGSLWMFFMLYAMSHFSKDVFEISLMMSCVLLGIVAIVGALIMRVRIRNKREMDVEMYEQGLMSEEEFAKSDKEYKQLKTAGDVATIVRGVSKLLEK